MPSIDCCGYSRSRQFSKLCPAGSQISASYHYHIATSSAILCHIALKLESCKSATSKQNATRYFGRVLSSTKRAQLESGVKGNSVMRHLSSVSVLLVDNEKICNCRGQF